MSKNDRKTLRKGALVGAWWGIAGRIKEYVQDANWSMAREVGNIQYVKGKHVTVNTDCLWESFKDYIDRHFPMYENQWTKNGFCLILYRLTGAKRTLMKIPNRDPRVVGARFNLQDNEDV